MNYTELKARVASYLHRTDLDSLMSTFVENAEARLNRALRVRQMEVTLAATTIDASNEITLPADFLAFKHLWPSVYPYLRLSPQTIEAVLGQNATSGNPTMFAVLGSSAKFDGSGDVEGIYYGSLPGLVANSTNWLSASHPDLYLHAVAAEAAAYCQDQTALQFHEAKAELLTRSVQAANDRDRFQHALTAQKAR